MTEPIEQPEPEPTPDDDQPMTLAEARKLRREAASLRKRMHDMEEQIGAQAAREIAHQQAVVAAAAKAAGLIDPSDFLAAHPDIGEFIDDEFHDVLPDKVAEAAAALLEQKPHLGRPVGAPPSQRPIEGLRTGARAPEEKTAAPTWASALRGR